MDILVALLPAICWGSMVLLNVKIGGGPYSQTLGMTIGAFIFSTAVFFVVKPEVTPLIFLIGVVSGLGWSLGQSNQLKSIDYIGVSKTMPISTGMQLVATALFGVIIFKEWSKTASILLGTLALIFIVSGVLLNSLASGKEEQAGQFKHGVLTLIVSTLGFLTYAVIVRLFHVDSWSAIFPQAIGVLAGGILLTLKHRPFNKYAFKNIISGFLWAAGNLFLFISQPKVGVATSFSLSQMGIVISTFGGIFLLGERKTRRQLFYIVIGSFLIIIGAVFLGIAKE
ncbi:GRP family sugar transporter [Peribacillus sp. SCS-155]|uniref:GRP family sugar transporter n=1 Tax=Peribacillus sedimenti TaxID=3115297 RepID=UPI0039067189